MIKVIRKRNWLQLPLQQTWRARIISFGMLVVFVSGYYAIKPILPETDYGLEPVLVVALAIFGVTIAAVTVSFLRSNWRLLVARDAARGYAAGEGGGTAIAVQVRRSRELRSGEWVVLVADIDGLVLYGGSDFDEYRASIDWADIRELVIRKASQYGVYYGTVIEFRYGKGSTEASEDIESCSFILDPNRGYNSSSAARERDLSDMIGRWGDGRP